MSNKNDNSESSEQRDDTVVIDAAVPVLSDEQALQESPPAPGRALGWFALLLALLALVAVAAQAWWSWQQKSNVDEIGEVLTRQASSAGAQFDAARDDIESLKQNIEQQLNRRDDQIERLTSALEEANAVIDGQGRRLLALTATTTDDWRVAEVEYLLRLANQRLLTAGDASSALELLTAADRILLELNDPRLFELREAIAQDRIALAQFGELDIDGIYLALAALSDNVDELPLLVVPDFEPAPAVQSASTDEDGAAAAWSSKLASIGVQTWRELKSLVVIQPSVTSIKPLLPPEQQYYLRSNLRLLLNQAQLALLDGRETAYQGSLQSAISWVSDYFPMDEPAIGAYIDELNQLLQQKVQRDLPDVSESLLAVRGFIARQHAMARSGVVEAPAAAGQPAEEAGAGEAQKTEAESADAQGEQP